MNFKHYLSVITIFLSMIILFSFCQKEMPPGGGEKGNGQDNQPDNGGKTKITKYELWSEGSRLRGANIYQRRIYAELDGEEFLGTGPVGPPYTHDDFNKLSQMGANYVNISHPGIFRENPPYEIDKAILDHLKNLIDMIGQADMFAVISFRTGPGRSEFTFFWGEDDDWFDKSYYNDRIWRNQGTQEAWAKMWKETARNFHNNPYVVGYDLMVEPNSNEVWLDIWDPDEFYNRYADTFYDWNQLYPEVVNSIREVDETTPVLIGPMAYSAVEWLPYMTVINDKKTVYMVHQYAPHVYTHQEPEENILYPGRFDTDYDGIPDMVDRNWLLGLLTNIDDFTAEHDVVVSCNEFGLVRWAPGGHTFMADLMDLFEQRGMNHALWVWEPDWLPWSREVNHFNFRFGTDPHNTRDQETSALIEAIMKYWTRNTLRPSNVAFGQNDNSQGKRNSGLFE